MIEIIEATYNPISYVGKVAGICYQADITDEDKNYNRGIECIESNHGRPLEYSEITFIIDGYSAKVIRELYTHIIGTSRLQSSTRYVNYNNFEYIIPKTFNEEMRMEFKNCMNEIKESYRKLLFLGAKKEDASQVLPLSMNTQVVVKFNLRSLIHFFEERTCSKAYHEMRELCNDMLDVIKEHSKEWNEISEKYLITKCMRTNKCFEKKPCRRF